MQTTDQKFGLEDRTYDFAKNCRMFVGRLSASTANSVDLKQLIRSSGSIAANFIEAIEALSSKDYILRIKICRKEAKESVLWLRLLKANPDLIEEARSLTRIFGSILEKHKPS